MAQNYKWATNNSTTISPINQRMLQVLGNGSVITNTDFVNGQLRLVGVNNVPSLTSSGSATATTQWNNGLTLGGSFNTSISSYVADPLVGTDFYVSYYANTCSTGSGCTTSSASYAGWTFISSKPVGSGKTVVVLIKYRLTNGAYTTQWVRFLDGSDGAEFNFTASSGNITSANNPLTATVVGGNVKIALAVTSTSSQMSFYGSGTGATGTVSYVTGEKIRAKNPTGTATYCQVLTQVDGGTGLPDWMATLSNTATNNFGSAGGPAPQIGYNGNGNLMYMPVMNSCNINANSIRYQNFTGISGIPVSSTTFGLGTVAITSAQFQYGLFNLAGSNGSYQRGYTSNLGASNTNNATNRLSEMVVNKDSTYIVGNITGTYVPGGIASSIVTAGSGDMALIKLVDNGSIVQPTIAARYGSNANETFLPGINNSYATHKNQLAIDTVNNVLYFNFLTSGTGFSAGPATIQSNANGAILQINPYSLTAINGLSLIGASSITARNSNTQDFINAVAVDATGNLFFNGTFTDTAYLRLNSSTTNLVKYTNYQGLPVTLRSTDAFISKVNATLTTLVGGGNSAGASGRSKNNLSALGFTKTGNLVSVGNIVGTLSWNGTAYGGTVGVVNAGAGAGCIILADTTTGTILNVIITSATAYDAKVGPDGNIYVCSLYNGGWASTSYSAPFGGPMLTRTGGAPYQYPTFISKLDPVTLAHLGTLPIFGLKANSVSISSASNINGYKMDIDPSTGDIYVTGLSGADSLVAGNNFVSSPTSYNLQTGSLNNVSLIGINTTIGCNPYNDKFVAKFNSNGVLQWGAMTGVANSSDSYQGGTKQCEIKYMNGMVYTNVSYTANNATGPDNIYYGTASASGSSAGSVIGTTSSTSNEVTNYLLAINSTTGALAANKSFGNFNTTLTIPSGIGVDRANNRLYNAGYFKGTQTFAGSSLTSAGSYDAFLEELDPNNLADIANSAVRIGGNANDNSPALSVDASGKLFFIMYYSSGTSTLNTASGYSYPVSATNGGVDYLVGAIDPINNYKPLFTFTSGSANNENPGGIVPGPLGTIFVCGDLDGITTFGNLPSTIANTSGDILLARIDYPYQGPGGVNASLNGWFFADVNKGIALSNTNATSVTNQIATPGLLSLTAVGSVPYNIPTVTNIQANFFPSISTSASNYMAQSAVQSGTFTNNGKDVSIFTVYNTPATPSAAGNIPFSWQENITNSSISQNGSAGIVTGTDGTSKTASLAGQSAGKWQLLTSTVSNTGAISNYLNGGASGTATGATALNVVGGGIYQVGGGSAVTNIPEMATYGFQYAETSRQFAQISTYFDLKYGITQAINIPYVNGKGDTMYNYRSGKSEAAFPNDIAGIEKDISANVNLKQAQSTNSSVFTIGANNSIATTQDANTANLNDNDFAIWGADLSGVTSITISKITTAPSGLSICAGYNINKVYRVKMTPAYASRSSALKNMMVKVGLKAAGLSSISQNSLPNSAGSYYLFIDRNDNGLFTDAADQIYKGTSLLQSSGLDSSITFNNVEFDKDGSGADQFIVAWRTDGAEAAYYSSVGTTGNMMDYCYNGTQQYFRDPSNTLLSYALLDQNGNTGFAPESIKVTRGTTKQTGSNSDNTLHTSLMNYKLNVSATGTFGTNGGVKVRMYYDSTLYNDVADDYTNPSWIKFEGTAAQLDAFYNQDPTLHIAWAKISTITPSATGITANGVKYAEFMVFNFSTFAFMNANAPVSQVLPVTLSSFTANCSVSGTAINWQTASEMNTAYFLLQRSNDAVNWITIEKEAAAGNSATIRNYTSNDANGGNYFYRLQVVDNDGSSKYSNIASTHCGTNTSILKVFPNPLTDNITVSMRNNNQIITLELVNAIGQIVLQTQMNGTIKQINVKELSPGGYHLRAKAPNGTLINSTSLIKK